MSHRRPMKSVKRVARVVPVAPLMVDPFGFIRADGVVIGKRIVKKDEVFIEVKDRDKRRAVARGNRYVYISVEQLHQLLNGEA